jgi:hypothetical protein
VQTSSRTLFRNTRNSDWVSLHAGKIGPGGIIWLRIGTRIPPSSIATQVPLHSVVEQREYSVRLKWFLGDKR